jgi:hypothetical protein
MPDLSKVEQATGVELPKTKQALEWDAMANCDGTVCDDCPYLNFCASPEDVWQPCIDELLALIMRLAGNKATCENVIEIQTKQKQHLEAGLAAAREFITFSKAALLHECEECDEHEALDYDHEPWQLCHLHQSCSVGEALARYQPAEEKKS